MSLDLNEIRPYYLLGYFYQKNSHITCMLETRISKKVTAVSYSPVKIAYR